MAQPWYTGPGCGAQTQGDPEQEGAGAVLATPGNMTRGSELLPQGDFEHEKAGAELEGLEAWLALVTPEGAEHGWVSPLPGTRVPGSRSEMSASWQTLTQHRRGRRLVPGAAQQLGGSYRMFLRVGGKAELDSPRLHLLLLELQGKCFQAAG